MSGIIATGSNSWEYIKEIVLEDSASFSPWKAKITSILDVGDCEWHSGKTRFFCLN